jgi:hypothetical protein
VHVCNQVSKIYSKNRLMQENAKDFPMNQIAFCQGFAGLSHLRSRLRGFYRMAEPTKLHEKSARESPRSEDDEFCGPGPVQIASGYQCTLFTVQPSIVVNTYFSKKRSSAERRTKKDSRGSELSPGLTNSHVQYPFLSG